jgi:hypothetical protein
LVSANIIYREVVSNPSDAIRYVKRDGHEGVQYTQLQQVDIYKSRQTYKSASIRAYGSNRSKLWLTLQTVERVPGGGGWNFDEPEQKWSCAADQIPILQAFLNEQFPESGRYTLAAASDSALMDLAKQMAAGEVDAAAVSRLICAMSNVEGVAEMIAESDERGLLTGLIERHRQQKRLAAIRAVVEDPAKNERDIQRVMQKEAWLFGGRYLNVAARRKLDARHEVDIPLIRADGALHIVELKQANVSDLVVKYRNEWVVGPEVNLAVGQVLNYMRAFDEQRGQILEDFQIDTRRAAATVVIGHPDLVTTGASKKEITTAIRTYNTHLSRVEVMTFEDLLDGAARSFALSMTDDTDDSDAEGPDLSADGPPEEPDWANW